MWLHKLGPCIYAGFTKFYLQSTPLWSHNLKHIRSMLSWEMTFFMRFYLMYWTNTSHGRGHGRVFCIPIIYYKCRKGFWLSVYKEEIVWQKNNNLLKKCVVKSSAQKMKFSIEDFFSKCDQIRRKLRIWSHLLKKSFKENFIFCAVELASSIIPVKLKM